MFVGEPADEGVPETDAVETPEEVADIDWVDPAALPEAFRDRQLLRKHLVETR